MSNLYDAFLQKLIQQTDNQQFWFNYSKDLLAYHYSGKRGLAIRRPKPEEKQVIELPLGIFLLRNNGIYNPLLALRDEKSEFVCIEYPDKAKVDTAVAQAILFDFCCKRDLIAKNPRDWYDSWAKTVGNSLAEVKPYPVLAELLMLKKCKDRELITDLDEEWIGGEQKLHDIELQDPAVSIEVKSTTARNKNLVTISSKYQLERTKTGIFEPKPLYLAFFTFQAASPDDGLTLEKLIQEFGAEYHDVLTEKSRIKEGNLGWNDKAATLVSCKYYRVDRNFPKITSANFDGGTFPEGIEKIIYDVNLTGVSELNEDNFFQELLHIKNGIPPEQETIERTQNIVCIPLWLQQLRNYLESEFPGIHQFDDCNGEICLPVYDNETGKNCLLYPFHDQCELYEPERYAHRNNLDFYRRGKEIPSRKCKGSFLLLSPWTWEKMGISVTELCSQKNDFFEGEVGLFLDAGNEEDPAHELFPKPYSEFLYSQKELNAADPVDRIDGNVTPMQDEFCKTLPQENLHLVEKIAHDLEGLGLSLSDLISAGNSGLMLAAEKYDPSDAEFSSYAARWVKESMRHALANCSGSCRIPAHSDDKIDESLRKTREINSKYKKLLEQIEHESTSEETAEEPMMALAETESELIEETVCLSSDYRNKFTHRRCDWLEFVTHGETIRLELESSEKKGSFKNLLIKVATYVWKQNKNEVKNRMQTRGYSDIAASMNLFKRNEKTGAFTKIGDDCFINTKLSAADTVKFILNLLDICSIAPENVRIHLDNTVTRVRR